MTLHDSGVDSQVNERVARIGVHDDAGMLLPAPGTLLTLRVAGPRQEVARAESDRDQQTLWYRSSSHAHLSDVASTKRIPRHPPFVTGRIVMWKSGDWTLERAATALKRLHEVEQFYGGKLPKALVDVLLLPLEEDPPGHFVKPAIHEMDPAPHRTERRVRLTFEVHVPALLATLQLPHVLPILGGCHEPKHYRLSRPPPARPSGLHSPPMTCHACGTQLSSTARFCHKCGAAAAGAQATGWKAGLPWALAGAALGALITVVVMRGAGSSQQGAEPQLAAPRSQLPAPDISQMSPQERATRLFNRVMTLAEAGKDDSVRFFLPMALGAYNLLPELDADARYHIGMLQLAGGDTEAALAQADTIQRAQAAHLFIYVLRAHAYQQGGNAQQERRAYAEFLRNEPTEIAKNRPEYIDHRDALNNFKAEATRVTTQRSGT